MNFFRYNIVVAAYPVFVYVVSGAGRQVDWLSILYQQYYNKKVHIFNT